MISVFLGGEGPDDIGDWAHDPAYRSNPPRIGIIEALLRAVEPSGWEVVEGISWCRIRKYRAGQHRTADQRNVRGLALMAKERGCDVLAFVRDRNDHIERQAQVEAALAELAHDETCVVGGVAIQSIDAWLLALLGASAAETMRNPKEELKKRHSVETSGEKSELVSQTGLDSRATDAPSLETWLTRAARCLVQG